MRNALLLLTIWLGILFAAYAVVYLDGDQDPFVATVTPEPADAIYMESAGRFGVVFPPTWQIEETGTQVILSDPERDVDVAFYFVEASVPEAALIDALDILKADENPDVLAVEELDAGSSVLRAVRMVGPEEDGRASYAIAYQLAEETLVVLVSGDASDLDDRAAELEQIESGIAIPASELPVLAPVDDAVVEL